jgi:hypothetical protein
MSEVSESPNPAMPARGRLPDVIALDQGATWRLTPRSERAQEWLQPVMEV